MKALSVYFSSFLFALLVTASSLDPLVRDVDMDLRGYVRRGDVLIPPACARRKTAPASGSKEIVPEISTEPVREGSARPTTSSPESSSDSESVVVSPSSTLESSTPSTLESSSASSTSESSSASGTTSSTASSRMTVSNYAKAAKSRTSSSVGTASTSTPGASNDAISFDTKPSVNKGITPVGGGNDAIKVNSVPSPANASVKTKRSSHRSSGYSSSEITTIETHSIPIVESHYVDFDWTDWSSLCNVVEWERSDDAFTCTSWDGFDGPSAFEAHVDPCLQQRFADVMITYAKKYGGIHRKSWIREALKYRRHPRKVVKILGVYPSTPYCLEEPKNEELYGVWNTQLKGVDFGIYGGPNYNLKAFGDEGTCPWGLKPDTESCGCIVDIDFKKHRKSIKKSRVVHDNSAEACIQTCNNRYRLH